MNFLEISLFFIAPAVAAAINSVAGGGTFLTFPVFIMNGLTPLQANVMSTIALWPGAVASSYGYRKMLVADIKKLLPLLIIGVIGGAAGSLTLLHTPEIFFKRLVPWLLLFATLIFTFGRYGIVWMRSYSPNANEYYNLGLTLQLLIAFYGGYFGAGIGILILAVLQMLGLSNIHEMNALKTLLATAINVATVIIFIIEGQVIWHLAFIMIAGGIFGGYVGVKLALKIPPKYIRWFVSCIGFSMSFYFFLHNV